MAARSRQTAEDGDVGEEKKRKGRYSPPTRTRALARVARGDSIAQVARDLDIDAATIQRWKKASPPEIAVSDDDFQNGYLKMAWAVTTDLLAEIQSRIPDMKDNQLAVTFGIISDKIARIEERQLIATELRKASQSEAGQQQVVEAEWWRQVPAEPAAMEAPPESSD